MFGNQKVDLPNLKVRGFRVDASTFQSLKNLGSIFSAIRRCTDFNTVGIDADLCCSSRNVVPARRHLPSDGNEDRNGRQLAGNAKQDDSRNRSIVENPDNRAFVRFALMARPTSMMSSSTGGTSASAIRSLPKSSVTRLDTHRSQSRKTYRGSASGS